MSDPHPERGAGDTHVVTAGPHDTGNRLDRVLTAALAPLARNRIKTLIEAGHVSLLAGTIKDPSYRVKPDDRFTVFIPAPRPVLPQGQKMALTILFEDEAVIVIDKPAGLVVHPAPGNEDHTLVNALIAHCGPGYADVGEADRPGIVHRLDKETSGLMVAAKTGAAYTSLTGQFADRSVGRTYRAYVWGVPSPREGQVEANIGRHKVNRKKMAAVETGGKHALTHYKTVTTYLMHGQDIASELDLRLATGRTHQIRVHMAHLGFPVIGDRIYGRAKQTRGGISKDALAEINATHGRQALHAYQLEFDHPERGERLKFGVDIPQDLLRLGRILGAG